MAYNSDHFDLTGWKLTLPINLDGGNIGESHEQLDLVGYEYSGYFYDTSDGAMVFRAEAEGATHNGSDSGYARNELREMHQGEVAYWSLQEGGTLSATLAVNTVPTLNSGRDGQIVIAQIHGVDDELVRLYYHENKVYFANDRAGSSDSELKFALLNTEGEAPNIALNETFSYEITAKDTTLTVSVTHQGQYYESVTSINESWHDNSFYFKTGIYLAVNEHNGYGEGQVSFYDLGYSHDVATTPQTTTAPQSKNVEETILPTTEEVTLQTLEGTQENDILIGNTTNHNEIRAEGGADHIVGGTSQDELYGGLGGDSIQGASGNDTLVGGRALSDAEDTNDALYGGLGEDRIYGNAGDDVLIGGRDFSDTDDNADFLNGGLGNDQVYGNAGNDTLIGALGDDKLYGGLGEDTFIFGSKTGNDTVYGFEGAGQTGGDTIQIQSSLNDTDIDSFAALMEGSTTDGTHSWIALGKGNGILVLHHTLDDFSQDDFTFI